MLISIILIYDFLEAMILELIDTTTKIIRIRIWTVIIMTMIVVIMR